MKRVGVLGTFVWDTIHHPGRADDPPLQQWGGISYSLSAFAAACPPGWCVVPIARLGADLAGQGTRFVSGLPNGCQNHSLRIVPEPNNRVELHYYDDAERTERLSGGVEPWIFDDLEPLLPSLDALFINYISGFELDLETAERVRRAFERPIYADLHSLCLGPPGEGPRKPRRLQDGDRWARTADYIQVNESELELVGGIDATLHALKPTGGTLLVTRGEAGASYWSPGVPATGGQMCHVAPVGAARRGDPTGCGDVWGAVTFCGILEGRPVEEAIRRGNRAAAAKLEHPRMDGLVGVLERSLAAEDGGACR